MLFQSGLKFEAYPLKTFYLFGVQSFRLLQSVALSKVGIRDDFWDGIFGMGWDGIYFRGSQMGLGSIFQFHPNPKWDWDRMSWDWDLARSQRSQAKIPKIPSRDPENPKKFLNTQNNLKITTIRKLNLNV